MANEKAVEFFTKLLLERHGELKQASETLITEMAGDNPENKKNAARRLGDMANTLSAFLPKSHVPEWLSSLQQYVNLYTTGKFSGGDFMQRYYKLLPKLLSYEWGFADQESLALDFDGIFEFYRNESRLPELFDKIVEILGDIKDSGALDSINMANSLAKVMATVKQGKSGSYFALNGAWEFLLSFANNYLWAELAKIPVLGTALESLKKTMDETKVEIFKLHNSVQQEMEQRAKDEVVLIGEPVFPHLTYGRHGVVLEDKTSSGTAIQA